MKIKTIISLLAACSLTTVTNAVELDGPGFAPEIKIEKPANDFVHFSFALDSQSKLQPVHKASQTSSDEYWFQTTGAELNKGLMINTTQAGALIRITQGNGIAASKRASELDTSLLELTSPASPKQSAIAKIVSKNQLSETGVFDNTLAIKTAADSQPGVLTLKTSQALNSEDTYMISVKEKNSPYRLNLQLGAQSYGENKNVDASVLLVNSDSLIAPDDMNVTLVAPDGQKSPVNFSTNKQGQVRLNLIQPQDSIAPINGLYEILVEAKGKSDGFTVQRNAKIALAFTKNTAQFSKVQLDAQGSNADLSFVVKKLSRFEVRGVLYGTNIDGELVPVMETHAAQTFKPGLHKIQLPFDAKILNQSQVSAPFELHNVRLFDQKQLGLIDSLSTNLVAY